MRNFVRTPPHIFPLLAVLLSPACSSDADPRAVRLSAITDDCQNPVDICREIYPPQCESYCADDQDGDCTIDADGAASCDGDPCVVMNENGADPIIACPGDDCTVSYDAATMTETIECSPGNDDCSQGNCDGPGGSEPGCSGDDNGDGVCDDSDTGGGGDGGTGECRGGGDGSEECPFPL